MPIDKVGRARQDEGKRRLSVFPDDLGLEQHICDVTLWVREKFRLSSVHVCVGRHYGHKDRELSGVTIIASPWHPDPITSAVVEAFLALGYAIEDAGADVYGYPVCDGNHSRHEVLRAFGRIEAALNKWRAKS